MKKIFFIIATFFLLQMASFAQLSSKDSLRVYTNTKTLVEEQIKEKVDFYEKLGLGSICAFTLLGLYFWIWGIKKKAEDAIKEKSGEIIETKLKEKIGADWTYLSYLATSEKNKEEKVYSQLILVVNKGNLANDKLKTALTRFKTNVTYKSFAEFEQLGSTINTYKLIIMDGRDNQFDEKSMTDQVDKYGNSIKMILLTSDQLTNYAKYSVGASRITKDVSRLYIPIEDLLL